MSEVLHTRENAIRFFHHYLETHREDVAGKKVIDLSAGSGYIANEFHKAGASVALYDLFPSQNTLCPVACKPIDLQKPFPIDPASADIAILGETIEHLPNQFFFFTEAAKILKPGGTLLLTTPNSSSLRSRLSQFLMESEHYSTPAPNETDAFTKWPGSNDGYFSKLFISGLLRLRTLAALNGLVLEKIHPSKGSSTSYLLLIFYPVLYYFSRKNLKKQAKSDPGNRKIYEEIFKLNTSVDVLTSKHLIVEWSKT
ncbi:MAG TPA: methyltransferase domain-containing protein [Cyclobacteriaceae bacterium]|nr:methyltransferase domain-containing protein [Cyclobacteriaceae bacterium]